MNKKIFMTLALSVVFALGFSAAITSKISSTRAPVKKEVVANVTAQGALAPVR